jgi:hypothetical protein
MIEAGAVFIALREMGKEPLHIRDSDTLQLAPPGCGNPVQFRERSGSVHVAA